MIEVTYKRKHHALRVTGHAYCGRAGEDILCSAASILAYTYAYAVENAKRDGIATGSDISMEKGNARIRCTVPAENDEGVTAILDNIVNGFALLGISYPDRIKIIFQ